MKPFSYVRAETTAAALQAHQHQGSRYLAGGTNLLDLLKEQVVEATRLVDLTWLREPHLQAITPQKEGGLWLGALVKNAETAEHPRVKTGYPLLRQAILAGASPQLRNMASNGGNLLQRTRCPYFYEVSLPCNKRRPGSGCSALEGVHDNHAILGWNDGCVAIYPGDMANALYALEAKVQLRALDGKVRKIPVQDFHRLPGDHPEQDNVLQNGELIEGIHLPPSPLAAHSYYLKVRERASYAFGLVAVAAALQLQNGRITRARLVLGGVAHKPWRAEKAEAILHGQAPAEVLFQRAATAALAEARPLRDNAYKVELARRAIGRALLRASGKEA